MKNTLVLGASTNPDRYAYKAMQLLQHKGHKVFAIGQKEGEVAGVSIVNEPILLQGIDTITLYLNPARQREYYSYILEVHPKRVVFNPGTENPELYGLLQENNIAIEIACTLVLLTTNQY